MRPFHFPVGLCLLLLPAIAQQSVTIRVDTARSLGPSKPIWSYFGYDEPNYTYTAHGRKLISELAALRTPVYIRAHNLLTTGDGTPALKWGSTNAYTEDAAGRPVYRWDIVDRILDTYLNVHARPFVEIGFMPRALSTKPEPYQHRWPQTKIAAGWAYPPKDYQKWAELIYQWVRHETELHGAAEVSRWYWEVWNEPDIEYWQGTPEEYDRLYDFAVDAVKRAAPHARVGGPATTGPASAKAAAFLRQFLEHCATGRNFATGATGAPLDFITYHAKGRPNVAAAHVQMGLAKNLDDVEQGMRIVTSFPKFHDLPIILSESDPEGCAACSARTYPQNAYRNGPLYPCYTAAAMNNIFQLADGYHANIEGMLTWAFEFEDQPYFEGFRTLASNGIDKPVLNVFRMAARMGGDRVAVESSAGLSVEQILQSGVRQSADVNAMATRSARGVSVMAWNYHDDDVAGPEAAVRLTVTGLPAAAKRVQLRHYRIDRDHSNAYTAWQAMGSPQNPTPEQYRRLEAAGKLQMLGPPQSLAAGGGQVEVSFALPRQAVSLLQIGW
ncbi:MAG TPA: beta-xylosidase [Solibacterales bacterium]|nr:beta-xylosidase [Bryobacterales bacterium]